MDTEKEIYSLHAETLALSIVVVQIFSKLARDPALCPAIVEGFNQSSDIAEQVAIMKGKSSPPEHAVKALRIIEELRAAVLGDEEPKHWRTPGSIP